jgi:hypothetical protein
MVTVVSRFLGVQAIRLPFFAMMLQELESALGISRNAARPILLSLPFNCHVLTVKSSCSPWILALSLAGYNLNASSPLSCS